MDTLLIDYCRDGDPLLAGYLLDNGADPNLGGLLGISTTLLTAIISDQPSSLISKIIQCGAKVSILDVIYAIRQQRADILETLLSQCRWESCGSQRKNMKSALQEARKTKNKEIISLVEKYVKGKRKW